MLKEGNYMRKIDLKDAYFTVPLEKPCRRLVRFLWERNLYKFLCLCFGLGPVHQIFVKLLKVSMSLLRRLNFRLLIYMGDTLLMSQSIERRLVSRGTVIFFLQLLRFVIKYNKSVMEPVETPEYLGLVIDLIQMTLSLTEEKVKRILQKCKIIFSMKKITVFAINAIGRSSVIHHTSSSLISDSILLPTTSTRVILEKRNVLQRENYS